MGGDDQPAASPSTPTVIAPPAAATPTPTAEPTVVAPATAQDLAAAEAEERYRAYLAAEDAMGAASYQDSRAVEAFTVSPERTAVQLTRRQNANAGLRQVGTVRVASLTVTTVDLEVPAGDYPTVIMQTCVDVSGVDVLDVNGRSAVTADRPPRVASTVTMYRYEPGTVGAEQGGWYVYEATSESEPC